MGARCTFSMQLQNSACLLIEDIEDTEVHITLMLTWKTDCPVWVDQWPLPLVKLCTLTELVQEQSQKGHTESPLQAPGIHPFVIKTQTGKWHLLQDL